MNGETFRQMTDIIRRRRGLAWMINILDRVITMVAFLSYPLLLGYLYLQERGLLFPCVMVPAVSFAIVTLFRKSYNARRPYERYDFEPIIHKNTIGKSFPSRHVFSIFVIAMTFFQVDDGLGLWLMVMGVLLGTLRVFGGVHFIRDVVVGALAGIVAGCIGYYWVFSL